MQKESEEEKALEEALPSETRFSIRPSSIIAKLLSLFGKRKQMRSIKRRHTQNKTRYEENYKNNRMESRLIHLEKRKQTNENTMKNIVTSLSCLLATASKSTHEPS